MVITSLLHRNCFVIVFKVEFWVKTITDFEWMFLFVFSANDLD
jgi:hypothetical protein